MSFVSKNRDKRDRDSKVNLFYYNIEPKKPLELAKQVKSELKYFERYLYKAIESLDVSRYGLEWEIDERRKYKLYPCQRLKVFMPKSRIKAFIEPKEYSEKKPIIRENGEAIKIQDYILEEDTVIFILEDGEDIAPNEKLFYGLKEFKWEKLSAGLKDRIEYFHDDLGNQYKVVYREKHAQFYYYDVSPKPKLEQDVELFVGNLKIDYELIPIITLQEIELRDKEGEIDYTTRTPASFKIETSRKIKGLLKDQYGRRYDYQEIEKTEEERNLVTIILKESESDYLTGDSEERSKIDLFFELLYSSSELEIWESPEIKRDDNKRIKVKRIIREEARLELERLPNSDKIYPSKNSYQLNMQLNALKTLIYRPAPEHRKLLTLFEPYSEAEWESPQDGFSTEKIEWIFLKDDTREGTEEQKNFVIKALNTPDFAILEGPPGSGKTTAISELIYQLLKQGKRVLLSASTHVAVDNVIEKLEKHFKDKGGPMENGIVPLRIGRETNISHDVKKYQIENRIESLHEKLNNESWFSELSEEEKERYLTEFVIFSSNLVCGTTIGILQYPNFKKKRRDYVVPEFDYLIIDEASKTTFQEFLVPAIYAKRWILVGDVNQLSPYTDTLHVRVNLDGILQDKAKENALLIYLKLIFERNSSIKGKRKPKFVYVSDKGSIKELYRIISGKLQEDKKMNRERINETKIAFVTNSRGLQNKTIKIPVINEVKLKEHKTKFSLISKELIFVDRKLFTRYYDLVPCTHLTITDTNIKRNSLIPQFRHLHWFSKQNPPSYAMKLRGGKIISDPQIILEDIMQSLAKNWSGELAWRMKRVFELQMATKQTKMGYSYKYYEASMHALLPPEDEDHKNAWREIIRIGRVSLPSILLSIQEGLTQFYRNDEDKTVISHGLRTEHKEPRYEALIYQHRMHPEISKIPRELFYHASDEKKLRLRDVSFLKEGGRGWSYNRYNSHIVWIDVKRDRVKRNSNPDEAEKIINEMEKFIQWAKNTNEKNEEGSKWTVMILTFYEGQRRTIRDLLRKRYPENRRKETRFYIDGITVMNYTVDKAQGREADIVFLSMVRNHKIGFMDSPNRINVAITRARYQLVIVGNKEFFEEQKSSYEWRQISKKIKSFNPNSKN